MMTIIELLNKAIAFEQQNRLDEAERLYTAVLRVDPRNFDGLHRLGVVRSRKGQHKDAEHWISKAITQNPRSAHAHNNLGSVLFALQRRESAVEHYKRAIIIDPNFADAHNNLAAALTELEALKEAFQHYEIALRLKPDQAETHNNFGVLFQRLGRRRDGVVHFEAAIRLNPNYPEALNNLGAAFLALGDPEKALEYCGSAVRLRREFPEAQNSLGNALTSLGRASEAIQYFQVAISLHPEFSEAHNNLGAALDAVGDTDKAMASFKKAAELDPAYADPYANMGAILLRYGNLDEARSQFERAAQLSPKNIKFLLYLAELKRFSAGDPHIELMERLSNDSAEFDESERVGLHFTLSKAYSDIQQHEQAGRHMVAANSLKRRQFHYNEDMVLKEFLHAESVFTPELMQRAQHRGNPSIAPIFIIGMPRSGTTLIEQVLSSQGEVFGAGELSYFSESVERISKRMAGGLGYPEFVPETTAEGLRWLGDDYLRAVNPMPPRISRFTDKMPSNFRFAGLIHLALPNARIIHACRDPIDTCLSCYSILFSEGQLFTYDLAELGRFYRAYQRLMRHWHRVLPASVMIDVQYEKLVADFEGETRRILAHCDLEWSPACLEFHKTYRPVRTASAIQVRQPLYTSAVGRWRPYEKMLRPLLDELNLKE